MSVERDVFMVNVNRVTGSVFVKTLDFFRDQGGFREEWGTTGSPSSPPPSRRPAG